METAMFKMISEVADKWFGVLCVLDGLFLSISTAIQCRSYIDDMWWAVALGSVATLVGVVSIIKGRRK